MTILKVVIASSASRAIRARFTSLFSNSSLLGPSLSWTAAYVDLAFTDPPYPLACLLYNMCGALSSDDCLQVNLTTVSLKQDARKRVRIFRMTHDYFSDMPLRGGEALGSTDSFG
ncbi:hypothetical protein KC331_g51 [Hortaea werneckii]|nr:hypothetical protein KC331_g51 [Hortaea werneckii]